MNSLTIISKGIYHFGNVDDYQGYKVILSNGRSYFEDLYGNQTKEDELYDRQQALALSKYKGKFDKITLENLI